MEKGKILATIDNHEKSEYSPMAKDLANAVY